MGRIMKGTRWGKQASKDECAAQTELGTSRFYSKRCSIANAFLDCARAIAALDTMGNKKRMGIPLIVRIS